MYQDVWTSKAKNRLWTLLSTLIPRQTIPENVLRSAALASSRSGYDTTFMHECSEDFNPSDTSSSRIEHKILHMHITEEPPELKRRRLQTLDHPLPSSITEHRTATQLNVTNAGSKIAGPSNIMRHARKPTSDKTIVSFWMDYSSTSMYEQITLSRAFKKFSKNCDDSITFQHFQKVTHANLSKLGLTTRKHSDYIFRTHRCQSCSTAEKTLKTVKHKKTENTDQLLQLSMFITAHCTHTPEAHKHIRISSIGSISFN